MIHHQEYHKKKSERLNAFVDAVLAIVITLLVLDLRVPLLTEVNSTGEMMGKLSRLLPHFYAFLLCFLAIAQFWLSNNAYFSLVEKYDKRLASLVIAGLLPICLLPFAAALIGEYPNNPGSFVVFGGLYLGVTIMGSTIIKFCWRNGVFHQNINLELFEKRIVKFWWVGPSIVILVIGTAFINTKLSLALFMTMLVVWLYMTNQLKLSPTERSQAAI